jgi:hypothetical protein
MIGIAALATVIGVGATLAAEPSGEAVAVVQAAGVDGAAGNRPLEVKGPVFTGDVVKTDRGGQAQILFRDDTKLVVGPSSELTIDRFVYAGSSTAREFTIDAVRGAFRFISGSSQKQAYTIRTPTATIGVRGTRFDVTVIDRATNLALYDGAVRLCDITKRPQRCTELEGRCRVIIVEPDEDFRWVNNVYERTDLMDTVFPYAFNQNWLQDGFRVQSRGCEIRERVRRKDTGFDRPERRDPPQEPRGNNIDD